MGSRGRPRLAAAATGALGLKVASVVLSSITSLVLTHLLGTAGYGAYVYAMSWVAVLGVPASLGLDQLLVRNITAYQAQSAWGLMSGFLRWANQATLKASLALALLAAVLSWPLAGRFDAQMLSAFRVVLILFPLVVLNRVRQAILQGLHQVVVGTMPQSVLQPIVFIVLLGGAHLVLGGRRTGAWAVGTNCVAAGVIFLIVARLLQKAVPQEVKEASPQYRTMEWWRCALPLVFVNAIAAFNGRADTLMLGAIKGPEAVGIYGVANRGAELISFALMAVNPALAPTVASLYAEGDVQTLQRIVTKSARLTFVASLPIALGLILFGHLFLMLFGRDFTQGQTALAILSTGQLINTAMGSVGLLLIMTGYERDAAKAVGLGTMLNVFLNALLIPKLGLEGAAIASASSIILWNVLSAILLFKRVGIHSTALGRIELRSRS
jgi:O-antigen/teichoic acid export membrane protein